MLVVVAIVGVLAAMLLPAVQMARESARRSQCQNNLRQLGLAFHNHADAHGGFPNNWTSSPAARGWMVDLLPFLESEPLRKNYHYDKPYYDASNQPVISQPLSVQSCPSSPSQLRVVTVKFTSGGYTGQGACGDYYTTHAWTYNFEGKELTHVYGTTLSTGPGGGEFLPLSAFEDGLSQTILVHEQAMKPETWVNGVRTSSSGTYSWSTSGMTPAWAYTSSTVMCCALQADGTEYVSPRTKTHLTPSEATGGRTAAELEAAYPYAINISNTYGIYGFHPAGANVLLADGSVHLLSKSLKPSVLMCLMSINSGDLVKEDQY
jgi:prepilin-type processing-associated H-X9-DG protein